MHSQNNRFYFRLSGLEEKTFKLKFADYFLIYAGT